MGLADVGFMRALAHTDDYRGNPAMTVLTPSDPVSAYNLVLAMAEHPGACYLRAVRGDLPILYREDERFPFGGYKVVRRARVRIGLPLCSPVPDISSIAASRPQRHCSLSASPRR